MGNDHNKDKIIFHTLFSFKILNIFCFLIYIFYNQILILSNLQSKSNYFFILTLFYLITLYNFKINKNIN